MAKHWIVVWDPEGVYWEGSLIEERNLGPLRTRGAALLPVSPELFRLSGVGGFHKRAWGAGWPLDAAVPKMHSPMTMYCTGDYHELHWTARLVCAPELRGRLERGDHFEGTLRITPDSGQVNSNRVGLQDDPVYPVVAMRELGAPDAHEGWTIGGRARVTVPGPGHYSFALYGTAPGLRVAWAAISLAG